MTIDRRALLDLAATQHGLVTRSDLHRVLPGSWPRRALVADGTLEAVGRRTFRVVGSAPTLEQRAMAAVLDSGGVLSHRSAAWLHGLPGFSLGRRPEVTVPGGRIPSSCDLAQLHTTTFLPGDDRLIVRGIPTMSVARSLLSLATLDDPDLLRAAVDDAVRLRLASDRWLWWRLEHLRSRGRGGIRALEAVLQRRADVGPTESWLEREVLEVLERAGVPLPTVQRRVHRQGAFVARVDFAYDDVPLVIEALGHTHHASELQLIRDAQRRNALQLEGFTVLEFLSDDVVRQPATVVRTILDARARLAAVAAPARPTTGEPSPPPGRAA
ncbi:MAG TPA: DUF559 domain-containing protein [Aquihabitans sp.]|nr:DUF559 domain-containing protein [Aquihabitans sp.]